MLTLGSLVLLCILSIASKDIHRSINQSSLSHVTELSYSSVNESFSSTHNGSFSYLVNGFLNLTVIGSLALTVNESLESGNDELITFRSSPPVLNGSTAVRGKFFNVLFV